MSTVIRLMIVRWAICPAPAVRRWTITITVSAALLIAHGLGTAAAQAGASGSAAAPTPFPALPRLDVKTYMGRWYQVAWFPNSFQRSCVSDTTATYALLPDGNIEVGNRCRRADGSIDGVIGIARPDDARLENGQLMPARLEVNFVSWLHWLPFAWGRYQVVQLADDGRYAVVSEPSRTYLWVLARAPQLVASDEAAIRSRLLEQGFDLSAWRAHRHQATSSVQP